MRRTSLLSALLTLVCMWAWELDREVEPDSPPIRPGHLRPVLPVSRRASLLHPPGAWLPAPVPRSQRPRRLLVLGIDGCRPDVLETADAPHLRRLMSVGAYAPDVLVRPLGRARSLTVSGPGWATFFTGAWPDAHGVIDNTFVDHRLAGHPDLFARIRKVKPGALTVSLCSWAPVNQHIARAARSVVPKVATDDPEITDHADAMETVRLLDREDPFAIFLFFNQVDFEGHRAGFEPTNPRYTAAIHGVDGLVELVLAALSRREAARGESWLVAVTTDHGGSKYQHGFLDACPPEVIHGFLILSGEQVAPGAIVEQVHQIDALPTMLTWLGIRIDPPLAGKVVGLEVSPR